MSPKIIQFAEQTYLGMAKTFPSVEKFDPDEVFFKLFIPNLDLFKKYAVDENLYAFPIDNKDGTFTYLAGCKVKKMDEVPDHMPDGSLLHVVPAGKYLQFGTTPRDLGEIAEEKLAKWFTAHPEFTPISGCDIEIYPPECTSADSLCWNLVPVQEDDS